MANLRFEVVAEAFKKRPVEVETPKVRPSEYFAKYVFNRQKMYKYLPSDVYEKLIGVIATVIVWTVPSQMPWLPA